MNQQVKRAMAVVYVHVVVSCIFLISLCQLALGGTCWLNTNSDGRCTQMMQVKTTEDECCNNILASSPSAAWSEEDLTARMAFYMHIQGGTSCKLCKRTCQNVKCSTGKTCVMRRGEPKCVCSPNCKILRQLALAGTHQRGPICGSDGRTYKSTCRMMTKSCRRQISLSIAYYGPCQYSCSKLKCSEGKKCIMDQNMIPHCVKCSIQSCTDFPKMGLRSNSSQVCGSNEVTYKSMCHLRQAACDNGKAIPIAYRGPCKKDATCHTVKCGRGQKCLTDIKNKKLPRCVTCNKHIRWCYQARRHPIEGPICSTNGKTYKNWCDMTHDACRTGIALDTAHFGKCWTNETVHALSTT